MTKRTDRRFNHVTADQSMEWLNGLGKKSGGFTSSYKTLPFHFDDTS